MVAAPPSQSQSRSLDSSLDLLRVANLGVQSNHVPILEDVSFHVRRGTTLAIVGPNGAGKTTLFRVLLGLVPHTGTVEWAGPVRIGYVPQNFVATDVPVTVRDFLEFKGGSHFEESLAAVGLEAGVLSKRLDVLSGGEMQRVLIAWAVFDRPNVLLFDEPTATVDIGSEDMLYETLNKLEKANNITVLLITHDIHIASQYSDAVLALNRTVRFFGAPARLSDPDLLKEIFGRGPGPAEHKHDPGIRGLR
ncbi:MAG TPA: metal ABC transporter ATP-binding protein [Thermoplasmata archaeon]|nr:metal ABC transporter ATP-binding protein [Thermoplasmata archaeon]